MAHVRVVRVRRCTAIPWISRARNLPVWVHRYAGRSRGCVACARDCAIKTRIGSDRLPSRKCWVFSKSYDARARAAAARSATWPINLMSISLGRVVNNSRFGAHGLAPSKRSVLATISVCTSFSNEILSSMRERWDWTDSIAFYLISLLRRTRAPRIPRDARAISVARRVSLEIDITRRLLYGSPGCCFKERAQGLCRSIDRRMRIYEIELDRGSL